MQSFMIRISILLGLLLVAPTSVAGESCRLCAPEPERLSQGGRPSVPLRIEIETALDLGRASPCRVGGRCAGEWQGTEPPSGGDCRRPFRLADGVCSVRPPFPPAANAKRPRCIAATGPFSPVCLLKMVRPRRLELPRAFAHNDLNVARLPIPPRPHIFSEHCRTTKGSGQRTGRASSRGFPGRQWL